MRINNITPANIFSKKLSFCAVPEMVNRPQIQTLQEDRFYRQEDDDYGKYTAARARFTDIAQNQLCLFAPYESATVRKKDGTVVPIFLNRVYCTDGWYEITAEDKETRKCLGRATVGYPRRSTKREFPVEGYKMQNGNMNYLWISNLDSYHLDDYQGVGARIFKEAVCDSEFFGFEGRIALTSRGRGEFSPAPFYYRMGMRSIDPDVNEKLDKLVPQLKKGGRIKSDEGLNSVMYLPEAAARRIIGYGEPDPKI